MDPTTRLTPAEIDAFGAELDALRREVAADLGERDATYIRRIARLARDCAITGRGLLMFGFTPVSWTLGVAALSTAKILENMELGHNVMHGQYDWMNDPGFDSQTYEWDNVCDSAQWRHYHNVEHHTYTNILGKDRDVGYGLMRVSGAQRWHPKHLVQPLSGLTLTALFQWGVGVHDIDVVRALAGKGDQAVARQKTRTFLRKASRQVYKDYVFFPVLALWNAPRVLAGNLAANLARNVWTAAIIFCGHFPDGARMYTRQETRHETRGEWYLRQVQGSANIEGSRAFHVLSGHLSHQIEHHLFPDLPAHRYPEVAPRVRALCERYGLPYNSAGFWTQYGSVVKNLFRYALPEWPARAAVLPGPAAAV